MGVTSPPLRLPGYPHRGRKLEDLLFQFCTRVHTPGYDCQWTTVREYAVSVPQVVVRPQVVSTCSGFRDSDSLGSETGSGISLEVPVYWVSSISV